MKYKPVASSQQSIAGKNPAMHLLRATSYELRATRGFTLVEMIVAVALFAVVMLVSVGALLSLTGANHKAQALQSVMNNLNVSLDGMVRAIRMGTDYNGSHGCIGNLGGPNDCTAGTTELVFEAFGGNPDNSADQWAYSYDPGEKRIYKLEAGNASPFAITAPEVSIESMGLYGVRTMRGCDTPPTPCVPTQPKVVIAMTGIAKAANAKTQTTFNIQATAVQRLLDL